jgi:hypothetical protein
MINSIALVSLHMSKQSAAIRTTFGIANPHIFVRVGPSIGND